MGSMVVREKEQYVRTFVRGRGDLDDRDQDEKQKLEGQGGFHSFSHENLLSKGESFRTDDTFFVDCMIKIHWPD